MSYWYQNENVLHPVIHRVFGNFLIIHRCSKGILRSLKLFFNVIFIQDLSTNVILFFMIFFGDYVKYKKWAEWTVCLIRCTNSYISYILLCKISIMEGRNPLSLYSYIRVNFIPYLAFYVF